ncbi:MAG: M6 family metalloprotease domain-containing protein, partial [Candidatus Zixiibacteriota bacterium]
MKLHYRKNSLARFRVSVPLLVSALLCVVLLHSTPTLAAPPHPDLKDRINEGIVEPPPFMKNYNSLRKRGVCDGCVSNAPAALLERRANAGDSAGAQNPALAGAATIFRALAILVDFSDKVSVVTPTFFDTMLFVSQPGTVRDYYGEISYGQLDMVTVNLPSSLGWTRAPQTYAYYTNAQNGTGSYPQNSQKLTEDLVDALDGVMNFAVYDNDANGFVDVLIIVHTGPGAEFTGSPNDIWSHKWSITPRLKDGVWISDYTIQPEYWSAPGDLTIGVYAHELGHGFGLPDLYDTDNSSWGLGRWSL